MTPEKIIRIVSHLTQVPENDILSKSQMRRVCEPRQIAHYFMRKYVRSYTLQKIAGLFGGLNHATICHSVKTVDKIRKYDKKYNELVCEIERAIQKDINFENEPLLHILAEVKASTIDTKAAHDKILAMGCIFQN